MKISCAVRPLTSAAVCTLLLAAGCQQTPVEVSEVLNHGMCQTLRTGLTIVDRSRLPQIRGARLLNATPPDTTPPAGANEVLVAVSNGSQPTPGYAFKLDAANARDTDIVLDYAWLSPPADAVLAQVVTSPCSVVRLVNVQQAQTVSARLDGRELGRARLPASAVDQ